MRVVAPALALGNAVVLKPSPETPISGGIVLAEIFAAAGLPAGLLQVVPGGVDIGEAIVAHPGVAMIHFTGSTRTGRKIAEVAGRELKHCSLELGGDNALLVLDDADVEHAAMIGAWSAWHYQGQTCITAGRHIVARPLYDRYVAALAERAKAIAVGDPTPTRSNGLGPDDQRDAARPRAGDARRRGLGRRDRRRGWQRRRALLPPDGRHGRPARLRPVGGGDLRADRAGDRVRLRGGGDRARQRHAPTGSSTAW